MQSISNNHGYKIMIMEQKIMLKSLLCQYICNPIFISACPNIPDILKLLLPPNNLPLPINASKWINWLFSISIKYCHKYFLYPLLRTCCIAISISCSLLSRALLTCFPVLTCFIIVTIIVSINPSSIACYHLVIQRFIDIALHPSFWWSAPLTVLMFLPFDYYELFLRRNMSTFQLFQTIHIGKFCRCVNHVKKLHRRHS